jgi:hypothetical protein
VMMIVVYAAMAMARAGVARGPGPAGVAAGTVTVCDEDRSELAFGVARMQVTGMYARIGVTLVWHDTKHCPDGALRISFFHGNAARYPSEQLGYALPYEGSQIVIFWERIAATASKGDAAQLLAHVMAHEIGHVLEATSRHSASGLMKAHWDKADVRDLCWKPMPFAEEDIQLIYLGLKERASRPFASKN